jgi:protocatechuate 3,4-dioxygenase beta subunit
MEDLPAMTTAGLPQPVRRREALLTIGASVAAARGLRGLMSPDEAMGSTCLLQRETTEGPYYLDLDLVRRNVRGGRKGTPLTLRFKVVDAATCKPIKNAAVEIWHCDARGVYSGVSGNSGNFLRGIQRSDADGRVRFDSIFPGWYPGRTSHIHMKVFVGGREVHTGQVFFREGAKRRVYAQGAYASRGQADTGNGADMIYGQAGSRALLSLKRKGRLVSSGYTGSLTVGVTRS